MKLLFIGSLTLLWTSSIAQTPASPVPKPSDQQNTPVAKSKPIALMGGTIETLNGIIKSGVILTDGNKITYVGDGMNIRIGDVTKIDCSGQYIYAGFCDPFVMRGLTLPDAKENEVRDTLTNAPASMRSQHRKVTRPDVKSAEFIDMKSVADAYQKAGYTHVVLAPSKGIMRGPAPIVFNMIGETKNILLKEIAYQAASIAGGGGFGAYPGSTFAAMAVFRQTMNDAQTFPMNADVGLKEINEALAPILAGTTPMVFMSDDYRTIYRSLTLSKEYGIQPMLAYAREAYRLIGPIKESGAAIFVSPAFGKEPTMDSFSQPVSDSVLEEEKANWAKRAANVLEIQKAGIPFAFTASATGMGDFYDGLRWLNANGLSHTEIVKAMTLYPAQILGIDNELGSLEEGKIANITIMSADLLDKETRVKGVIVNGKYIEVKAI